MKVAAIHVNSYLEYAAVRGVQVTELRKHIRNLPVDLTKETALINVGDFYSVLRFLNAQLNDELWSIKAGNFLSLKLLGLIYRISLQATTIEEALHYLETYLTATMPLVKLQTTIGSKQAGILVSITNEEDALNRLILENLLTVIGRELTMMSTEDINIRLSTPFFKNHYPDEWRKGEEFAVYFRPSILKASLRNWNGLQLDVLIPEYLKLLEGLKSADSFTDKVKLTMLSMSNPQLPGIQTISQALHLTPRTVQRRLSEENSSFRTLSEEVKKQVCTYMLRHKGYTLSAIAHILGYSEPASFNHAFKKWFANNPEKVRRDLSNSI